MSEGTTLYCGDNCNHTGPHRYPPAVPADPPSPLDDFHLDLIRKYVAAGKREVGTFAPGGTFEMLEQVLATLDAEVAAHDACVTTVGHSFLCRSPEHEVALSPAPAGRGVRTECPLVGVHEHAFRGPHTFDEWYDGAPPPAPAGGPTPEGYWWCHRHQLDTRTPEDHNLHEKDCHHFAALASSPAPAGLDVAVARFLDYFDNGYVTYDNGDGSSIVHSEDYNALDDAVERLRAATRPAEEAGS